MIAEIEELIKNISEKKISTVEELELYRLKYLSKKGLISEYFARFKEVPPQDKKHYGLAINRLKDIASQKYTLWKDQLKSSVSSENKEDLTKSSVSKEFGTRHPISIVRNEIISIFSRIGFTVADAPEIEDDWHVFSGLNFPENHPARDMQDTFFILRNPDVLLRTHTSSVQVRVMENTRPPIRQLMPGRVFRNEAISSRSHCIFHQIEGLYIDNHVSFADLKQTLLYFAKEFFGSDTKIRLRPSFFPFTEPSAEMDVSCSICGGTGCKVCKYTGYLEIMGCGMVDPNVLEKCNISSTDYTGFAFGMGIERIAMLKYQISDIRYFFDNDIRFLKQFMNY